MEIGYSDGRSVETRILDLVRASTSIDSSAAPGLEMYREWPVRYHLCPERSNLVRHLNFQDLEVAEIGAGMGAVSRFLAEQAKRLTVVEGTQARYSVLSSRLRDLKNWSGHVGNFENVPASPHDVVCVVGVLEYSDVYMKPPADFRGDVYDWFLQLASKWIHPEGVMVLAIENKLGLKYWAGAPEDHTDRRFDGVCGYRLDTSPRTFSLKELVGRFNRAGFGAVEQYFPFPDYKVPTCVLSREFIDRAPEITPGVATTRSFESYGIAHAKYFPELLALDSLSRAGLAGDFSNSLLLVAARDANSPVLRKLLSTSRERRALGWHYSNYRKHPMVTEFVDHGGSVTVRKENIAAITSETQTYAGPTFEVIWKRPAAEVVQTLPLLRERLVRIAYFDGAERAFDELLRFLRSALNEFGSPLRGEALDAIFTNVQLEGEGFRYFDREWSLDREIHATWFVLRNTLAVGADFQIWQKNPRFATLESLYAQLCAALELAPVLAEDIEREAQLQSQITANPSKESHTKNLSELARRTVPQESLLPASLQRYKQLIPPPLRRIPKKAYLQLSKAISESGAFPSFLKRVL